MMTAIFTYNRPEYLLNCLTSVRRFCQASEIVIVDDGSTEEYQHRVLRHLEAKDLATVWRMLGERGPHGGLYRNINCVLDYASSRGHPYVNLLQDDMQYVCSSDHAVTQAMRVFRRNSDALQVSMTFRKVLDPRPVPAADSSNTCYISKRMYAGDTGVIDVCKAQAYGFRFGGSEEETSESAGKLGFRAYVVRDPCVAFVPWPRHHRYRREENQGRRTVLSNDLLINPLLESQLQRLRERPLNIAPLAEDYCWPSSGWWLAPYEYNGSYIMWLKKMVATARSGAWTVRHWPRLRLARDLDA